MHVLSSWWVARVSFDIFFILTLKTVDFEWIPDLPLPLVLLLLSFSLCLSTGQVLNSYISVFFKVSEKCPFLMPFLLVIMGVVS